MKLEKLTENKIRVILNLEDLEKEDLTLQDFLANAQGFQKFFVNMLDRAEKELGFVTKDCKLLIESFSSPDGVFVFTITKFSKNAPQNSNNKINTRKKLVGVKKRTNINALQNNHNIYAFNNFDEFCSFCNAINSSNILNRKPKLAKNIALYLYNNTYYLILHDINLKNKNLEHFYSYISEFSKLINYTEGFEGKLLEHGKLIIKNNAISTGIKFFVSHSGRF